LIDLTTDPIYKILQYFVPQPQSSLIEIGCGTALRTLHFAQQHDVQATLFDYSDTALGLATENARDLGVAATVIKGDLLDNPLPSNQFDIVWSAGLNEHFRGEDRQRAIDEMYRICKPGGTCIIIVPNSLNAPYRLTKFFRDICGKWPFGSEYPFTKWELTVRMKKSGLKKVETVGIGAPLSIFRWFFLGTRYANKLLKNPTPFDNLNRILRRIDLDVSSTNYINNIFGREIGSKGIK